MLGKPEDRQRHVLDATGVGRDVVLLENEIDDAAGAVDIEVTRHGYATGSAVLVEHAVAGILVHLQIFDGADNHLAKLGGVDKVVEVDNILGVEIHHYIFGGIEAVGGISGKGLGGDEHGDEVAVAGDFVLHLGIGVMLAVADAVEGLDVEARHVVLIEPGVA